MNSYVKHDREGTTRPERPFGISFMTKNINRMVGYTNLVNITRLQVVLSFLFGKIRKWQFGFKAWCELGGNG